LTAAVLGVGLILPLSAITYGWLVQYGSVLPISSEVQCAKSISAGGIAPPLVMTGISGFGLMITLTPLNT
jgi:hypothetical protein